MDRMEKIVHGVTARLAGSKKRRRIYIAGCCLLVAALLLGGRKKGSIEVETCLVETRDIADEIPASGKIRPVVEVKISPDVSGEIVELYFKEGDAVNEGDIVLKIRQDQYISQVEQAEAALNSLKADYQRQMAETGQAEMNFSRSEYLYRENAISQAEFESAKANLEIMRERSKVAGFSIRSGRAQLKETMENLKKTTVSAPMSGVISKLSVEKGERVVGTSQMAGTEMFRIADFSKMEAIVDVGENDIVRISPGDSSSIEIDAYPGRKFKGIVTQIANSAKNIATSFEQVANFEVRIEIVHDTPLLPGMSANVSILAENKEDCTAIPIQCVFQRNHKTCVWTVGGNGAVSLREIEAGIQDLSSIEVVRGLEPGEIVVCGPVSILEKGLEEGQKTRTKNIRK